MATNTNLVFTAFIRADNGALAPHRRDLLQVVERLQLGWAFSDKPVLPGLYPEEVASELSSHLTFFRQVRAWVVQHGCLPPVLRFKWDALIPILHCVW